MSAAAVVGAVALALAASATVTPAASSGVALAVAGHHGGPIRAVAATGTVAWIAEGIGITRIDLSRPYAAVATAHTAIDATSQVWSIATHGRFVFAGTTSGVHALDVADPDDLRHVGFLATTGSARAITVFAPEEQDRCWLLVTDAVAGVIYVEVQADGRLDAVAGIGSSSGAVAAAAIDGSTALVPGDGVCVLDLSRIDAPVAVGCFATVGGVRGLALRDGVGYISDGEEGIVVLPLAHPMPTTRRVTGTAGGRLVLGAAHLFVVEERPGAVSSVRLFDVADPLDPRLVPVDGAAYAALDATTDLAVSGARLLSARPGGLTVADVADPYRPQVWAEYEATWPIHQLAATGDCLYAVKGAGGMDFVDVASPQRPEIVLGWRPPGGVWGAIVHDGYAFASLPEGMARLDVHSACAPVQLEVPFAPGWPQTRWLAAGGRWLVATTVDELDMAELRGDSTPRIIGRVPYASIAGWPAEAVAQGIAVLDTAIAYVAAGDAGIVVVSLLEPLHPVVSRVIRAPEGMTVRVLEVTGRLLVVGASAGLLVYEISDPLAPRFVGACLSNDALLDLSVTRERVYAAADLSGLLVFDIVDPSRPTLVGAFAPRFAVTSVVSDPRRDEFVYVAAHGVLALRRESGLTPTSPPPSAPTSTALPIVPTATPRPQPSPSTTPSVTSTPSATSIVTPTDDWILDTCHLPLVRR